jgi:hypothetical protein
MNEEYQNEDFQHGFRSGTEDMDKETYEGFLDSQVNYEYFQERIMDKKEEISEINEQVTTVTSEKKELFRELQEHTAQVNSLQSKKNHTAKEVGQINGKIEVVGAKKAAHKTPYALLAGVLYLLAGIAFVAGDLIISHEIVAYALNIRNNVEAWAFAVGLASLSILLKPAYERLVEQPYLNDYNAKTKRIYGYFQTFLVVFAVGTMVVLGWFRYEAYKTDKLKDGINKQIQALQLDSQPIDPTQPVDNQALIFKMDEKLQAFDNLNMTLVNSTWALLSFVLSGVLFAIAGAICLGIAFPILHTFWYRWLQAEPAINRLTKRRKKLESKEADVDTDLFEAQKQQVIAQNAIDILPDLAELKSRKIELRAAIEELLNKSRKYDIDRRIYTYSDGYETGKTSRSGMTPEEFAAYKQSQLRTIKEAKDDTPDRAPKVYRQNGLRPHQALRKAITDGFREN